MTAEPEPALAELSFEEALKRLETIVARLESGDAPLAQSIELYQEGAKLRAQCDARLNDAQMRIERITADGEGRAIGTRPFDAA